MQGVTLAIGILGSILALLLRPAYALATYFAVLVWYPYYLRISIGTIDISASRIVVIVLLLRCLCDKRILRKFTWSRFDTLVALSMVVYVGIYCITRPLSTALENRSGFIMDTWFAYITVRLIVTDRETLMSFVKIASLVLAALAILGVIESVTLQHFFSHLKQFRPWRHVNGGHTIGQLPTRYGLVRSIGPFGHPIMFGMCFVMFLPLIWTLRHQRGYWGRLAYPLSALAGAGVFSSMSSGPWVSAIVACFCMVMERSKWAIKPILIGLVLLCVLVEVGSNSPLHHVLLARASLAGGEWWQRAKLIDEAVEHFDEWWLVGYGNKDPGWGIGRNFTDMNNQFILVGIQCGILGIVALCAVLGTAFHGLVRSSQKTTDMELKSIYWSLGCTLSAVIVSWQGVSFFGQPNTLYYIILGIIGSSFVFARSPEVNSGTLLQTSNSNLILAHGQVR